MYSSSVLNRREFLGAVGVAGVALGVAPLAQAADSKKIPVGLQLYSVREQCQKDLPGTLAAVSKIGYRGVEFAGYHGRSAKELRKLLDDNGLVACGTHTPLRVRPGRQTQGDRRVQPHHRQQVPHRPVDERGQVQAGMAGPGQALQRHRRQGEARGHVGRLPRPPARLQADRRRVAPGTCSSATPRRK